VIGTLHRRDVLPAAYQSEESPMSTVQPLRRLTFAMLWQ
jgi:hypothetical protein